MKVSVKIISLILVFAMAFTLVALPVAAASDYHSSVVSFWDDVAMNFAALFDEAPIAGWAAQGLSSNISSSVCSVSADKLHHCDTLDSILGSGFDDTYGAYVVLPCYYCRDEFRCYGSDLEAVYNDYAESLPLPEVSSEVDYFTEIHLPTTIISATGTSGKLAVNSYSGNKVSYSGVVSSEGSSDITINTESFTWNFASGDYSLTTSLTTGLLQTYNLTYGSRTWCDFMLYCETTGKYVYSDTSNRWSYTTGKTSFSETVPLVKGYKYHLVYVPSGEPLYCYGKTSYITLHDITVSTVYVGPEHIPEPDTRFSNLFHLVSEYNAQNDYRDDSTVINFYLSDSSGALYNPDLFSEDTMIFTEPKTGTPFSVEEWDYHYIERAYTLDLEDGSMFYGDDEVGYIIIHYADDKVYLYGYSSESTIENKIYLFCDELSYTAVAQDSCTIHGHSNTVETVREPTCTQHGERKYTCSTCGNELIEDIPMLGHSFNYEVLYDSTCAAVGTGIYTCSTCSTQYTEQIPKKEHVYEVKERVDTVYDEEGTALEAGYTVYECINCNNEYTEVDDVEIKEETLFNWLFDILKKLITGIIDALSAGLEFLFTDVFGTVLEVVMEFARWVFDILDLSSLREFFSWFSDSNPYYREEFVTVT